MVGDFDQGQAAMLFVVRAEAAIIRAATFDFGLKFDWHLAWLKGSPAELVIIDVGGNQDTFGAMLRAMF